MSATVQKGLVARARAVAPSWTELVPWTDRRNRLHPLRATVFALLLVPGVWLALRAGLHWLGPEPVNAAIHSTGYWTVWLLLGSLTLTPVKALAATPNIVVIRRMVGNAALAYAAIHLVLYATDQKWRVLTIISEILSRFYLTIGFVALIGLLALGLTSSDGWVRTLGKTWKRLHRVAYALMALGLVHYLLQSKLDVSQSVLAAGVFAWLMLWRLLPAGRDRQWWPVLAISAAAPVLALGYEWLWYRFGTRVDPAKVVRGEFDIAYGLHPAGQVLFLGLLATAVFVLRQQAMRFGQRLWFIVMVYVLGAFAFDGAGLFLGWSADDVLPDGPPPLLLDAVWCGAFAVLGVLRWRLRDTAQARLVDVVWLVAIGAQVVAPGPWTRGAVGIAGVLAGAAAIVLGRRVRMVSRATLALVPAALLLAADVAARF